MLFVYLYSFGGGLIDLDFSACQEPNPLSLKQPAAWPSVYSIADLWLARLGLSWFECSINRWVSSSFDLRSLAVPYLSFRKAELEHALAWRLDASDKSRPKRCLP